ncbi:Uncharacterized protein APZ42_001192 [Daphnia magna]|uniref:Uncharacterized protein n=1 Tax=Daphnia magna TaxID=35525 RepID=A0A162C833_9CRUS|nr:Uncharacterized protein APZ42_001192 [Daphnia magna]
MNASGNINKQTTIKVSRFRLEEIGRIVAKLMHVPFLSTISFPVSKQNLRYFSSSFLVRSKLSFRRTTKFF